jgi:uncharacterized protein YceK
MKSKVLSLMVLVMLAGCASVKIVKVTDDSTEGLRFYRPEPYLVVTETSSAVQWLPNLNQQYAIQVNSGWFGTVDPKITLDNGWNLTSYGATVTSDGAAAVTSFAGLITAAIPYLGVKAETTKFTVTQKKEETKKLEPGIYRFIFDKDTGHVKGIELLEAK